MIYPYTEVTPPQLAEQLRNEFLDNFFKNRFYIYNEDGVGAEDVHKYPSTKTHRKLFPELYEFTLNYYNCYILRNFTGSWCGYVKYENNTIDEDKLQVHGGITFHSGDEIGFDCNHAGDSHPFEHKYNCVTRTEALANGRIWDYKVYCDRDYAISELENLTRQLLQDLPKWSPQTHKQFPKLYRERMANLYLLWYLDSDLKKLQTRHIWIKILSHLSESERNY